MMFNRKANKIKDIQKGEIRNLLEDEQKQGRFKDINSENVQYLIEYLEGKYLIYVDADGDLDWEIEDSDIGKKADKILPKIAILQSKPSIKCFNYKTKLNVWILLGNAIAHCEDAENANVLISEAETYINNKERETTRVWIIEYNLLLLAITVCLLAFFSNNVYAKCCLYGALGSCFSVLLNVGSISVSCSAGTKAVFLECILKVAVGSISAFVITVAFRCGLILNGIVKQESAEKLLIIAQIAGGFCERFAPSILESIQKEGT